MTEPGTGAAGGAGALLRAARERQGLHIVALAAAIKVTPRKLEALESDRFDELPDATFTRALAQTVCRALKIDAAPVLALLPPAGGQRLERVGGGLNTPFRDRPGRIAPKEWTEALGSPAVWGAAVLVLAALVVYFLPSRWLRGDTDAAPPASASATTAAPAADKGDGDETAARRDSNAPARQESAAIAKAQTAQALPAADVSPAATGDAASAAAAAATPAPAPNDGTGVLQLRPAQQSWIEVTDARGQALISRLVEPGESVGLDGTPPFKLKIGNAVATQIVFRGDRVDLAPYTRDNVARLELK